MWLGRMTIRWKITVFRALKLSPLKSVGTDWWEHAQSSLHKIDNHWIFKNEGDIKQLSYPIYRRSPITIPDGWEAMLHIPDFESSWKILEFF